ncbi:MAG: NADH-quinone oxidoreductase subunit H [Candidatus Omnitrophica bacterium]|jgi:formate hydrogenlyase subunit 4|nr:NADH-quinone oxidoreductase subunit H [Candidatus Omnitrophota bacterium]
MIKIIMIILQALVFIVSAPFLSGLITKIKNNLRMRQGESILQPYYNLAKLSLKSEVLSETTSWIFKITPYILLASSLAGALLIPLFIYPAPLRGIGDFLALIFIFSLGRFFLSLAALDAGSSFGGMGSSREMFISSLVEPALCMVVFSIFLQFGSTDISVFCGAHQITAASLIGAVALFLICLAECARIPVDNQETHLELTMVQEAMILEYSGMRLAFIELAAYIKQMVFFFLIAQLIFPISLPAKGNFIGLLFWGLWYSGRIFIVALITALVEVSLAKMRLFRVVDYLGFAFLLGIIAVICAVIGV